MNAGPRPTRGGPGPRARCAGEHLGHESTGDRAGTRAHHHVAGSDGEIVVARGAADLGQAVRRSPDVPSDLPARGVDRHIAAATVLLRGSVRPFDFPAWLRNLPVRCISSAMPMQTSPRIQLKRLMQDAPSLIVACGLAMRRFDPV